MAKELLRACKPQPTKFLKFAKPDGDLIDFSSAYRNAAKQLAGSHSDGGVWAYPIVFLYRHAIEVLIKAIIMHFGDKASVCAECVLRRSHNLRKQIPDLETIAQTSGLNLSVRVVDLLNAWHKTDENGMKSRYPLDKDGKPTMLVKGEIFELTPFIDDCEATLDELEEIRCTLAFDEYQEFLREQVSN